MNLPLSFLWPQFLWLLLAVPLLVLAYAWLLRRKKKLALRYASVAIIKQAMRPGTGWRRHVPPTLFLLALAALLFAASRPLAVIALPSDHATIVLAMDVSLSMRATDVKPNRLVAAQEAAKAFLKELPRNVRVAIVTFAGSLSTTKSKVSSGQSSGTQASMTSTLPMPLTRSRAMATARGVPSEIRRRLQRAARCPRCWHHRRPVRRYRRTASTRTLPEGDAWRRVRQFLWRG